MLTGHTSLVSQTAFLKGFCTSIRLINAVVENAQLTGRAYYLLILMARYAQDDGTQVYPSVARLAKDSRQDERNVRRQLRDLEAKGFIKRIGRSEYNTCDYRIVIEKCYPHGEGIVPPVKTSTRAQSPSKGGKRSQKGGNAPSDSLLDSSLNRQELSEPPYVKSPKGAEALQAIGKFLPKFKSANKEAK